ncbi:MAG TPA: hypothetical protein VGN61_16685 [Verrucomicrobiae bacterium]
MNVLTSQNERCQSARLKLISMNEPLTIGPSDGRETIAQATGLFSYIDSNFRHWGCDAPGQPTNQTQTFVYEMEQDGTFTEMFGDLRKDADSLALTQSQIVYFVRRYPHWLKPGGNGTFFLFSVARDFFIAAVYLFSDGRMGVRVRRFSLERIFRAGKHHRLVVPQLASVPCFSAQTLFAA